MDLRVSETPVERWDVAGVSLLIKRDDLTAPTLGGNKVRALELLLAGVGPDHTLLTVGAAGSTHALAAAQYGQRLGANVEVITWPQAMHDVARATASRLERRATISRAGSPVEAYVRAAVRRLRGGVHWIPAGGSSALGAIGHVSAALELCDQLVRDGRALPETIVVPLGSGGTVAGLLVGLSLAGVSTRVRAVRVVPRVVANRVRVLAIARRVRALLMRLSGLPVPELDATRLEIDDGAVGGGYGHETATGREATEQLRLSGGPPLDATYSAKAFGAALALARVAGDGGVLFWLTFDGRWLDTAYTEPRPFRPSR